MDEQQPEMVAIPLEERKTYLRMASMGHQWTQTTVKQVTKGIVTAGPTHGLSVMGKTGEVLCGYRFRASGLGVDNDAAAFAEAVRSMMQDFPWEKVPVVSVEPSATAGEFVVGLSW